jgi:hypothetical protein
MHGIKSHLGHGIFSLVPASDWNVVLFWFLDHSYVPVLFADLPSASVNFLYSGDAVSVIGTAVPWRWPMEIWNCLYLLQYASMYADCADDLMSCLHVLSLFPSLTCPSCLHLLYIWL